MYRVDVRLVTTTKGLELMKKECKDESLQRRFDNADINKNAGNIVYLGWNRLNEDIYNHLRNLLYILDEQDITNKMAMMGENFDDVSIHEYTSSKDIRKDIPTPDVDRYFNESEINKTLQRIEEKTKNLSEFETIDY